MACEWESTRLEQIKIETLKRVKSKALAEIEKPAWMDEGDLATAVLKAPKVKATVIHSLVNRPHLPIVRGENGWELAFYRVEPMGAGRVFEDRFNPLALAGQLRAWLKHLEEVNALDGTKDGNWVAKEKCD